VQSQNGRASDRMRSCQTCAVRCVGGWADARVCTRKQQQRRHQQRGAPAKGVHEDARAGESTQPRDEVQPGRGQLLRKHREFERRRHVDERSCRRAVCCADCDTRTHRMAAPCATAASCGTLGNCQIPQNKTWAGGRHAPEITPTSYPKAILFSEATMLTHMTCQGNGAGFGVAIALISSRASRREMLPKGGQRGSLRPAAASHSAFVPKIDCFFLVAESHVGSLWVTRTQTMHMPLSAAPRPSS